MRPGRQRPWHAAVALALAAAVVAPPLQAQAGPDPAARPEPSETPRDPDFGVRTTATGLERVVEMYQWHRSGDGYVRDWDREPVDSSGFAPGHDNPGFPIRGQRWLPGAVSVDGHPLDDAVLDALGEWREFRPGFSALPGNLAATFQPEGDGLGSAENPLAPEVGDLRIHWRERVLPPLDGRIALRGGTWVLQADASPGDPEASPGGGRPWWLPIAIGGLLLLGLAITLGLRRKR